MNLDDFMSILLWLTFVAFIVWNIRDGARARLRWEIEERKYQHCLPRPYKRRK